MAHRGRTPCRRAGGGGRPPKNCAGRSREAGSRCGRRCCFRGPADRHQGEGRPVISHFFIDRPIFASVLSIVIVVVGLAAMQTLPVAQFPEITPPVVQIEADYPGANAEVVADSVARTIEVQLPGIDNLLYYDSTSTNDGDRKSTRLNFS